MPRAYSTDLRERVVAACAAAEHPRSEIARQFHISAATLYDWLRRWRESGSVAPAMHSGGRTSALNRTVLRALVEEANDATLAEYAERLEERTGRRYSASMLSRVLKELKLSRKGRRYAPRSTKSRRSLRSA